MRRFLIRVVTPVVVLAAVLVVLVVVHHDRLASRHPGGYRTVAIPMSDGVQLAADVAIPKTGGKAPLVVMPTSWGAQQTQYQNVARLLVNDGFVVVAYKQRGFDHNGGSVDFAGPRTVMDASQVIDWAVAHTQADPNRVGMLGDSYGAGVSLLTAEKDPRVKAVVAFSTWTDWGYSFAPNNTVATAALKTLFTVAQSKGVLSPELSNLAAIYESHPKAALDLIHQLAPERSPMTGVNALNQNHTAVMLANGMQDSIFAPQQLADFYQKLTGPKRLQLEVGDHTQPELDGFVSGKKTGPVSQGIDWLTHYLQGQSNGIDTQKPIELTDPTTNTALGYSTWPTASTEVHALNGSATITTGALTQVGSEPTVTSLTAPYRFANADLRKVESSTVAQWTALTAATPTTVAGTSVLDVNVTSSAPTATFFVYLYDVLPGGGGTLMSVTPETLGGLRPSIARAVSVQLTPTAWTLPAGDRLVVAIGSADGRWSSQNVAGSTIGFSSTAASPLQLQLATGS